MRIVVAAPPKAGNMWLKCLLGSVYDLEWLRPAETPERPEPDVFKAWVEQGRFRDGTIFHQHYDFSDEFCDIAAAIPAHVVTIIRDPYDAFVSSYFTIQTYANDIRRRERFEDLIGKPIDHPDVLAFLEDGFRGNLMKANGWLRSGCSVVVRYEGLHHDPIGELERATDQIQPVPTERIARAVEACRAENMRQRSRGMARHVRTATVGDWQNHLTEAHLTIFRERYADLIRGLGYEVR